MVLHPRKLDNVVSLKAQDRSDYFVRKVADFESVWGLIDQGWATAQVGAAIAVPFWPEDTFTELCAVGEWQGLHPKSIDLSDFLSKWLPGMERDGRKCLIFPTPKENGFLMSPLDLMYLIKRELQQYE